MYDLLKAAEGTGWAVMRTKLFPALQPHNPKDSHVCAELVPRAAAVPPGPSGWFCALHSRGSLSEQPPGEQSTLLKLVCALTVAVREAGEVLGCGSRCPFAPNNLKGWRGADCFSYPLTRLLAQLCALLEQGSFQVSITTSKLLHFNKLLLKANRFHLGEEQFSSFSVTNFVL